MSLLDREEYIEQAYFFRTFVERLEDEQPAQEILETLREEILSNTRLPMALDILHGELKLRGQLSAGMLHLSHYFTPFQIFVMQKSEEEKSRFDQRIALQILAREAAYRAGEPTPAGLFVFQFEAMCRNRLGYDRCLTAISADPFYPAEWADWIRQIRQQLGTIDFGDLVYLRSQSYIEDRQRLGRPPKEGQPELPPVLFSQREGRIARANRGKDPLYLFAALQRQLGYPAVPRHQPGGNKLELHPQLEQRLQRLEKRLHLLEGEASGKLDLSQFYVKEPQFQDDPDFPGSLPPGT